MTPAGRFWAKVEKTDDCWLWTGSKNAKGYGHFRVGGFIYKAHRWAWEAEGGLPIPDDLVIDHLCGTTSCVRPSHLEIVTRAENTRRERAARAAISHCKRGHEAIPQNRGVGGHCKVCDRERHLARTAA